MKESVTYVERYSPQFGYSADEAFSDAVIKKRRQKGQPLAAIIGDPQRPRCFIDIATNNGNHGVSFLDDHLRVFRDYGFYPIADGRLFLRYAITREYHEGTQEVKSATQYFFKEDGNIHIIQTDLVAKIEDSWDTVNDVSGNYEPFPVFGEYDSITRFNR